MEHIPLDGIAWLTREEFCAALRVERRTYMRLVADGFIQETRLGPSSIRIASTEMTALAARLAAAKGKKK